METILSQESENDDNSDDDLQLLHVSRRQPKSKGCEMWDEIAPLVEKPVSIRYPDMDDFEINNGVLSLKDPKKFEEAWQKIIDECNDEIRF